MVVGPKDQITCHQIKEVGMVDHLSHHHRDLATITFLLRAIRLKVMAIIGMQIITQHPATLHNQSQIQNMVMPQATMPNQAIYRLHHKKHNTLMWANLTSNSVIRNVQVVVKL